MRSRTTFYIALGRLLMVDLGEDEDKFETFMTPITGEARFLHRLYHLPFLLAPMLLLRVLWCATFA